jgi:hypothetical protein
MAKEGCPNILISSPSTELSVGSHRVSVHIKDCTRYTGAAEIYMLDLTEIARPDGPQVTYQSFKSIFI